MTPWMTAASLQCQGARDANTEVHKASTVSAAVMADERAQQPSAQDQLLLDMGRSICSMVTELKEINQKIHNFERSVSRPARAGPADDPADDPSDAGAAAPAAAPKQEQPLRLQRVRPRSGWKTSSQGESRTSLGRRRSTLPTTPSGRERPCAGELTTGDLISLWGSPRWISAARTRPLRDQAARSRRTLVTIFWSCL